MDSCDVTSPILLLHFFLSLFFLLLPSSFFLPFFLFMSSDLDPIFRDLEKQVNDFSLTMDPSFTDTAYRRLPQTPRRTHSEKASHPSPLPPPSSSSSHASAKREGESSDDDVCIASLQPSTRSQDKAKALGRSSSTRTGRAPMTPGLVRSLSASSRSFKAVTDEPVPPIPPMKETDGELSLVMQRAWAVLGDEPTEKQQRTPQRTHSTATGSESVESQLVQVSSITRTPPPLQLQPPIRTFTTRIYIDDAKTHKTVQLTSLLTTAMVIQYLRKKGLIDTNDGWALFEIANSHGVERPLREWELVLEVVECWSPEANNALLVKKYAYRHSLTAESILQKRSSPMHGYVSIEYKKGKWQKRFCYIKDNAIHHAKDSKGTGSAILCYLATFDVYTLLSQTARMAAPTSFVFALRAQDKESVFEREEDYIRLLAVDDQEAMKDWVLSIRSTKSLIDHQYHPHRVIHPLAPIQSPVQPVFDSLGSNTTELIVGKPEPEAMSPLLSPPLPTAPPSQRLRRAMTTRPSGYKSDSGEDNYTPALRRQRSSREKSEDPKASLPASLHRSESSRRMEDKKSRGSSRGLSRSATMRTRDPNESTLTVPGVPESPLIDYSEPSTFAKGSLLAKEEEQQQQSHSHSQSQTQQQTLIQQQQQQQQSLLQQQSQQPSSFQSQQQHYHHYQHHHSTNSPSNGGRAQEEAYASNNANTLIQLNDKVKFSKGSLLERNETTQIKSVSRSKSTREHHVPSDTTTTNTTTTTNNNTSSSSGYHHEGRQHSLRRKPTSKDRERSGGSGGRHHEPLLSLSSSPSLNTMVTSASGAMAVSGPTTTATTSTTTSLPSSATANGASGGAGGAGGAGGPLLQLKGTPEQIHTKRLLGRQIKPLLSFTDSEDRMRR